MRRARRVGALAAASRVQVAFTRCSCALQLVSGASSMFGRAAAAAARSQRGRCLVAARRRERLLASAAGETDGSITEARHRQHAARLPPTATVRRLFPSQTSVRRCCGEQLRLLLENGDDFTCAVSIGPSEAAHEARRRRRRRRSRLALSRSSRPFIAATPCARNLLPSPLAARRAPCRCCSAACVRWAGVPPPSPCTTAPRPARQPCRPRSARARRLPAALPPSSRPTAAVCRFPSAERRRRRVRAPQTSP